MVKRNNFAYMSLPYPHRRRFTGKVGIAKRKKKFARHHWPVAPPATSGWRARDLYFYCSCPFKACTAAPGTSSRAAIQRSVSYLSRALEGGRFTSSQVQSYLIVAFWFRGVKFISGRHAIWTTTSGCENAGTCTKSSFSLPAERQFSPVFPVHALSLASHCRGKHKKLLTSSQSLECQVHQLCCVVRLLFNVLGVKVASVRRKESGKKTASVTGCWTPVHSAS